MLHANDFHGKISILIHTRQVCLANSAILPIDANGFGLNCRWMV